MIEMIEMKKIPYNKITISMKVQDEDGTIGIVTQIEDKHNIHVTFTNGGSGIYCLVEGCEEIKQINNSKYIVPHYSPLYYL